MASKNNKNNNKKHGNFKGPQNKMMGKILIVIVGIILIVAVISFSGIINIPIFSGSESFTPPDYAEWGTFLKVSDNNYSPSGQMNIYFISWIGCPIGASLSWGLYGAMADYNSSISNIVYSHLSDPNEGSLANIPGVIFTSSATMNINGMHASFKPIYMYNETLFGEEGSDYSLQNGNGIALAPDQVVSYGLSVVQSQVPTPIFTIFKNYELKYKIVNLDNGTKTSANMTGTQHLTTMLIITGPSGTFILNGPLINPTDLQSYTLYYLDHHYASVSEISYEISTIQSYM
ncbi:DUF929 family protein [Caldiplasma sukawensis]